MSLARTPLAKSVGIVVVHGVIPHPRYEIQDACAANLSAALNDDPEWKTYGTWVASILNPEVPKIEDTLHPLPTVGRVRLSGDDANAPQLPHFDVMEAYWSPLDKGKATFTGVVSWLLRTVFVPLNTTARFLSRRDKTTYDVTFVALGILVVVSLLAGALAATITALNHLLLKAGSSGAESTKSAWQLVLDPSKIGSVFSWRVLAVLALGLAGAYLIAQAGKGILAMAGQRNQLKQHPVQRADRWRLIIMVAVAGLSMLALAGLLPVNAGNPLGLWACWFVIAALCFEVGRTVAKSFIVNFFADVQIYTTRDENSEYYAMRDSILDVVTQAIVHACSDAANNGKGYDRVFVLGHSLGSTICLDALMRFANLCEQEPASQRTLKKSLRRLRGFVTFGSPLEKTKYFFDVTNPSPSAAMHQWRNDAYGRLFTMDAHELDASNAAAKGIFWGNYWYFKDAIANEMRSYRSFVGPGALLSHGHHLRHMIRRYYPRLNVPDGYVVVGRRVSRNERGHQGLTFPDILPHGKYLGDGWFWKTDAVKKHLGVLDIVARWDKTGAGVSDPTPFASCPPDYVPVPGINATYETLPAKEAAEFPDHIPPPSRDATSPDENDTGDPVPA